MIQQPEKPVTSPELTDPSFVEPQQFWADGDCVALAPEASLPARCIRCNAPATARIKRVLSWISPWTYLLILLGLIPFLLAWLLAAQKMKLELPLCAVHARRHKRGIAIQAIGLVGIVALPYLLYQLGGEPDQRPEWVRTAAISSALVMLAVLLSGAGLAKITRAKLITKRLGWFTASEAFLAECAEVPEELKR